MGNAVSGIPIVSDLVERVPSMVSRLFATDARAKGLDTVDMVEMHSIC